MKQTVDELVTVVMYFSAKNKRVVPCKLEWQHEVYELGKVDYYHSYMDGRERQHIFELCNEQATLWFRLRLNSLNLHWTLEAIHDGNAD